MAGDDVLVEVHRRILTAQAQQARRWLAGRGGRVLEVGCSAGYFSARLSEDGREVWCTDLSAEHLERARRSFPQLSPFRAIMEQLPCRTATFDAVVALEVIEHTQDDRRAIAEAARVLRHGGLLALTTPNAGLFACLDPHNFKVQAQRRLPRVAGGLARMARFGPSQFMDNLSVHRHYSAGEMRHLLRPEFDVLRMCRTGLVLFPLASATHSVVSRILDMSAPRVALQVLMNLDAAIEYGSEGYNLMVLAARR